jgi:hypothetical protein
VYGQAVLQILVAQTPNHVPKRGDPDAIILLAVEEFSLKAFRVIDTTAKDNVTAAVLTRFVHVLLVEEHTKEAGITGP